ncbi:MAG: hypothetical protein Q9178_001772 [Gyalolechia marmorata]
MEQFYLGWLEDPARPVDGFGSTLVATLIYLVLHFRGLIPKNDIQRILATWGTLGSPSEAQAQRPASFSRGIVPIACHSHNDEERPVPLCDALEVGCTSVEATFGSKGGDLLVGHSEDSLKPSQTLRSLYIDPLSSILDLQNPALDLSRSHAHESAPLSGVCTSSPSTSLMLVVDLKKKGPITVVGTGNADFCALVSNTTYRDIFFDAPLDKLRGKIRPGTLRYIRPRTPTTPAPPPPSRLEGIGSEVWRPGRCTRSGAIKEMEVSIKDLWGAKAEFMELSRTRVQEELSPLWRAAAAPEHE